MASISNTQIKHTDQHKELNETEAESLFNIYRTYLNGKESWEVNVNEFQSVSSCPYLWKKLDVTLPIESIEKIAKDSGVVQLRPINPNDKVLIIGCGNKPLSDETGNPATAFPMTQEEIRNYYDTHTHEGAVTIDPFLPNNPTIAAFFGQHEFPMLKDGQFDLIVFEGLLIKDTDLSRKELLRLLSKTGEIILWTGSTGQIFNPDAKSLSDCAIDLSNHPSFSRK